MLKVKTLRNQIVKSSFQEWADLLGGGGEEKAYMAETAIVVLHEIFQKVNCLILNDLSGRDLLLTTSYMPFPHVQD